MCDPDIKPITRSVPPPCYHCKPPLYHCPKYECLPSQQYPPMKCRCPPNTPFVCRPRPPPPIRPPTLFCADVCPTPRPSPCPCPPKKKPAPPYCVRYCISTTCGQSTYSPCYYSALKCPPSYCC